MGGRGNKENRGSAPATPSPAGSRTRQTTLAAFLSPVNPTPSAPAAKSPLPAAKSPPPAAWAVRAHAPLSSPTAPQLPPPPQQQQQTIPAPVKILRPAQSGVRKNIEFISPGAVQMQSSPDTPAARPQGHQHGSPLVSALAGSQTGSHITSILATTPITSQTLSVIPATSGSKRQREESDIDIASEVAALSALAAELDDDDDDIVLDRRPKSSRKMVIDHDDDADNTHNAGDHDSRTDISMDDIRYSLTPSHATPSRTYLKDLKASYTPNSGGSSSSQMTRTPRTPNTSRSTGLGAYAMVTTPTTRKGMLFGATSAEKKRNRAESFKEKNEIRYGWLLDIKDADGRKPDDPEYDLRTLYIPPSAWSNFSPFERQFWEIKATHWDTVVFFKKGKFFELYEKDAEIAHQHFDLKMTDRVNMRMAGVPESSFEHWAAQFIAKGYKVAKVEQMETMVGKAIRDRRSSAKEEKVVRRELTSVLTTGTLVDAGLLTNDMSTYCMSIKEELSADHLPPTFGVCFVDTATAQFSLCSFTDDAERTKFETLLMQIKPKELVLEKSMVSKATMRLIKNCLDNPQINFLIRDKEFWNEDITKDELRRGKYFGDETSSVESWPSALQNACNDPITMSAFGGMLSYLSTLKLDVDLVSARNFCQYDPVRSSGSLVLDGQTLLNLEIFENSTDGSDRGTLFRLLNQCQTAFGKRLFKQWMCHPLRSAQAIDARLDAVYDLVQISGVLESIQTRFRKLPDLERTIARIHSGNCRVRDFVSTLSALKDIYVFVDEMEPFVREMSSVRLVEIFRQGFPSELVDSLEYFSNAFDQQSAMDAGKISLYPGFDETFDEAKQQVSDLEERFEEHRLECKRQYGQKGIVYKDMGKEIYQLEMPASVKVPQDWTMMSSNQTVKRYYNNTIRGLVSKMLEAREVLDAAVRGVQSRLYAKFDGQSALWIRIVRALAELDCLCGLAMCRKNMPEPVCRPELVDIQGNDDTPGVFEVEELRHPCVMQISTGAFIPNDTRLGGPLGSGPRMILLTGPNMGGKSTLLRQTCIAAIMAQVGCYVPAKKCRFSPLDRIFTRIGANDNIMAGQSTFMVELSETSKILREATPRSLVILDELGRGTSTYDGYAIAHAVLHHLVTRVGCLGLFSTHYGTLTEEFENNPLVANMHMSFFADNENRQVTFLYKLAHGGCPKSYGMNVATMADLPVAIVDRAEDVARVFERNQKHREAEHAVHVPLLTHLASFASLVKFAGDGESARMLHALCVSAMAAKRGI